MRLSTNIHPRAVVALALFVAALALPTSALALDGRVDGGGNDTVVVWKSKAAHDKGLGLILDGVHKRSPDLLMPYVACFVPSGTRVVTTNVGWVTHDVMVVEGKSKGCEGNVAAERFKRQ